MWSVIAVSAPTRRPDSWSTNRRPAADNHADPPQFDV